MKESKIVIVRNIPVQPSLTNLIFIGLVVMMGTEGRDYVTFERDPDEWELKCRLNRC